MRKGFTARRTLQFTTRQDTDPFFLEGWVEVLYLADSLFQAKKINDSSYQAL